MVWEKLGLMPKEPQKKLEHTAREENTETRADLERLRLGEQDDSKGAGHTHIYTKAYLHIRKV